MSLELFLLITIAIINLPLGIIVMSRGLNQTSSRYFAISVFFVCLWAIGDAMMLFSNDAQLIRTGKFLFTISPMFTTFFMVLFSFTFPQNNEISNKIKTFLSLPPFLAIFLFILNSNFLIEEVIVASSGSNTVVINHFWYLLYTAYFSAYFIASYVALFKSYKKRRGRQRRQVLYSLTGIFLTSFFAFLTNLTLPLIGATEYNWFGPIWTIFYLTTTTAAIVQHRLFDIKLVVARSVAYTLLLVTLGGMYGVVVFGLSNLLFGGFEISATQHYTYIFLALILAFSFQPLRHLFEKTTNNLFYQEHYNSQHVLDEIGDIVVNGNTVKKLCNDSLKIFKRTVKPKFIAIILISQDKKVDERYFVTGHDIDAQRFDNIFDELTGVTNSIIVNDELNSETRMFKYLDNTDTAVVARLETSKELVGYMMFGYKVSGNMYSSQDLSLISIATDELAVAIQNALRFEEISRFNITLQEEIKVATKQLRENNKKLQELDKAKDEFMSMASHQLRTPLTSVKGYISMILEGDMGPVKDSQRKVLNEAFGSTQRMVYLISDFLNVSRIQTGKFTIEKVPTKLADVVEGEVTQLQATAAGKGIKLDYQKPVSLPELKLDAGKISQVIMNFLDNAIYYSKPDTTIKIELSSNGKDVSFKVKDQGIGVPAHERPHLFSKFYRAGNARKIRPDGTGIGLFMAKKVIVGHEGAVIFESTEGKGSTFGFVLPLSKVGTKKSTESVQTAATR